jgi:hypothetical protein
MGQGIGFLIGGIVGATFFAWALRSGTFDESAERQAGRYGRWRKPTAEEVRQKNRDFARLLILVFIAVAIVGLIQVVVNA